MTERVLFVDDEPRVLDGIRRVLRGSYEIECAEGGRAGLRALDQSEFAVVVSDMMMPDISGPRFLALAAERQPGAIQMILSGHADLSSTIDAVNAGKVFRFLLKPIDRDALAGALDTALEVHRLRNAERDLLEQTLTGAVEALADILAIASPHSSRRAALVRQYVARIAAPTALADDWQLQVAATLAHVGLVAVPDDVIARHFDPRPGVKPLSSDELRMLKRHPDTAARVVAHIPRLEHVAALVRSQHEADAAPEPGSASDRGAILRLATDLAERVLRGATEQHAIDVAERSGHHSAGLFEGLRSEPSPLEVEFVTVPQLRPGMVLVDDLCAVTDTLIAAAGTVLTVPMLERIRNFAARLGIREPIAVDLGLSGRSHA
jgi:FixJ family two-component response regulator